MQSRTPIERLRPNPEHSFPSFLCRSTIGYYDHSSARNYGGCMISHRRASFRKRTGLAGAASHHRIDCEIDRPLQLVETKRLRLLEAVERRGTAR